MICDERLQNNYVLHEIIQSEKIKLFFDFDDLTENIENKISKINDILRFQYDV